MTSGSPSTQFSSERQPTVRGRKRGSPHKSSINKAADSKLDSMLGQAHKNIKKSLEKGDVKTSMWLVDTVRKDRGTRVEEGLLEPLIGALETLEDVEQVSQTAILLAIKGDMSFEQLKFTQEALARHAILGGVIELKRLREEVDEMVNATLPQAKFGAGHVPAWGRLEKLVKGDVEDAEEIGK